MDDKTFLDILHRVWGYPTFRGIQSDIIHSIAEGKDTLGLMPTGGGKSLTFQVPALAQEGVCIVITPLIALMKDQVDNLRRKGVVAAAIYSGMSRHEVTAVLDNCILGCTKLLYVSPERIGTELFRQKLERIKVSFITVDEAHCISQWGYDFRPSYLHIADIRQLKPNVPVLALTATATPQVVDDIQRQLGFKADNVFKMSFERKNLAYVVRETLDKEAEMIHILKSVKGSAIVYVRSRQRTKEISQLIEQNNISSTFYHAGLEHGTKDERQKQWHDDAKRVMVATNAFGMGIDKPDVRVVIHYDCPNSIEAYFQEAGRAGRDGNKAYAVLLYNASDNKRLLKRIAEEYPDKETVVKIYEHLAYYLQIAANTGYGHTFQLDVDRFARTFKHFPTIVNSALRILSRAGYIHYETDPDSRTRLRFLLDRDQLYILNDSSPDEEAVISVALREYSGMFTDYRYIDESRIAQLSGVPVNKVYLILKSLNQRRIVHFIPQRTVPLVTYTRDRELPENVVIPTSVYEDRKKLFEWHIKQMLLYAMNNNVCRSRQLLRYFGEEQTADCGKCDVCLARKNESQTDTDAKDARQKILALLSDGEWHQKTELLKIDAPKEAVSNAIRYLVLEELISIDHAKVRTK
ncbi:ATP-dependent DNA helicase RecQ [uncultured Prevotella sp.]|uniref:RecQ family ATP-dependent DNA helicase n=1 Tax=uncultured Prevotella sp. TaxID=159272 RepID=UPI0025EFE0E1|nr:ATP-dependent DNA helicase RecQ [uncultured Prevotella sp.]